MLLIITGAIVSYIFGAIPFGYLVVRLIAKKDIRRVGSGNIGATNVHRVLGIKWAVFVFCLDAFKGFAGAYLIPFAITPNAGGLVYIICGISAVLGHMYTVFLKFKGGKGVATSAGVILGLGFVAPQLLGVLLGVLAIWFVIFIATRLVSLASLVSAFVFFLSSLIFLSIEFKVFSFLVMLFIALRHKDNIKRLISRKELKV